MARIETLRSLYRSAGIEDISPSPAPSPSPSVIRPASTIRPLKVKGTAPYDAGSTGRRAYDWNATRIGQNTLLWNNLETIRARAREAIRNNPWAAAAIDRFESNVISTGIQPHFQHRSVKIRDSLQRTWDRWVLKADFNGQNDFYSLQGVMSREIFEAGEIFIRHRIRPAKDRLLVPYQIQLIEGEQLPVFTNIIPSNSLKNIVRLGIEFDPDMRRVYYHFYAEHPGEAMLYPSDAMRFITVDAATVSHVYKPLRAGQLRGEPRLTSVLTLLYELEQYADAALVKKKLQAMMFMFIKKPVQEDNMLPTDPHHPSSNIQEDPTIPSGSYYPDPGTALSKLEPGTAQELLPGEEMQFTTPPTEADFTSFMTVQLHKLAAGCGLTYEQLTGDLTHVNYSSIRSGMLEMRRAMEQFQYSVIINQACHPILCHWMDEAVLCGALDLPNYYKDPHQYQDVTWVPPGWDWVDPKNEVEAAQTAVRAGFTSRAIVIRQKGYDPAVVDAQIVEERKREQQLGLTMDSNPNSVLIGRETQPTVPVEADPDEEAEELADGGEQAGVGPSNKNKPQPAVKPGAPGAPPAPGALPKRGVPVPLPSAKPKPNGKPASGGGGGGGGTGGPIQ